MYAIRSYYALGVNSPSKSGFVGDFQAKSINFPTVNLGVQTMFKQQFGAKLDFGYNRMSSEDPSPEFKLNYSRVNAQFVYDPTYNLYFLPQRMGLVLHAGPGYSFVKPLGNFSNNNLSFFNFMGGLEVHFGFVITSYSIHYTKLYEIPKVTVKRFPLKDPKPSVTGSKSLPSPKIYEVSIYNEARSVV